ncbi:hypothetical protein H7849_13225 [Alloacidobacterium dinghuense]|uniref:NIF system FeS cluster assembly NifU C-terminal domain-containing protein n=1 Tax=Alloacidobacterium dinghuense TaxID=2763107 RepID=A0A7G8BC87_9BACT|nr:hypothetical protein [Alloacidobacterium dinghuense]QNI30157.1 hypothetical protein H7849_13225 [Alloacidobacterium dinghuense]
MTGEKEFQDKIRQLGTLVGELDQSPGAGLKVAARQLVQLLMEIHGTGLERIMEIVFESGPKGEALIDKLGHDPLVRNLLLLYSLHPDSLETRVLKGLDTACVRLRKFDAQVELIRMHEGVIQVRLNTSSHACGSTTKNLHAIVEECLYDQAPDLTSLSIITPEDEAASGFIPVENLLKSPAAHVATPAERG